MMTIWLRREMQPFKFRASFCLPAASLRTANDLQRRSPMRDGATISGAGISIVA
jgi:hypothetical protein